MDMQQNATRTSPLPPPPLGSRQDSESATSSSASGNQTPQHSKRHTNNNKLNELIGWFNYRPAWAQQFAKPGWALFFLCWAGALQGFIVNGLVNVVITTIEKRYRLKSSELGLIAGGYDMAGLFFLVPVSYFGAHKSKPACVASGVLILAFGALVFASPYFLAGPYEFSNMDEAGSNLCHSSPDFKTTPSGSGSGSSEVECQSEFGSDPSSMSSISNYKFIFVLGQFLHGVGAAPFYTLGCAYIDESVPTHLSSMYVGIFYTMAILGPGIGYVLGGQLLKVYVDAGVDPGGLTPSSSVWVGRWWAGFLVGASLCLLFAVPISLLPKSLPGSEEIQSKKKSEAHQSAHSGRAVQKEFGRTLADLPASLGILLRNPTFMFLNLSGASDGMLVSALASFLPKVIEQQFSLTQSFAALLVGIISLPGAGGGTFVGGWIVKHWNMNIRQILKTCVIFSSIATLLTLSFIISCPTVDFAGITVPYVPPKSSSASPSTPPSASHSPQGLVADCNKDCDCSDYHYDPVCGRDNVQYYSPCYAGCSTSVFQEDGTQTYHNCKCLTAANTSESYSWAHKSPDSVRLVRRYDGQDPTVPDAVRERCTSGCTLLPFFIVAVFLTMIFTFLTSMPSLSATMRSVADSQRSFGLGIQWIAIRGFGTIPSPLIFGAMIDQSCILWQKSCDSSGACLLYNTERMARNIFILALSLKMITVLGFVGAALTYKPPPSESDSAAAADTLEQEKSAGLQNHKTANGFFASKNHSKKSNQVIDLMEVQRNGTGPGGGKDLSEMEGTHL